MPCLRASFRRECLCLPGQREVMPREEVVYMLKISVNIKVTAGAVALLLSVLLRSCG